MKWASAILHQDGQSFPFEIIMGEKNLPTEVEPDLILDQRLLGRLRRELMWTLGESRMNGLMARLGYSAGRAETFYENKKIGPVNQQKDPFEFEVKDSPEAAEHRHFFSPSKVSQCWLLAGYLTGVVSKQVNQPVYFLESDCRAKGDANCRFVGKRKQDWEFDDQMKLNAFDEDNLVMELAETREQLKLTKDRYQNLFEQASVSIVIIDPETSAYLDSNLAAQQLTGYTQEELLKMTEFDLSPQEDHHRAVQYYKQLFTSGSLPDHDRVLIRKDGSRRTVAQTSKVLPYGGQRVIQSVMRDVTEIKEAEEKQKFLTQQLIRSERLSSIGRLAAGVAHELKNPLGAIRNAIYYMKNALANEPLMTTDPHLAEIMKLAESEIDASVQIIQELLDFSHVVELIPRRTNINHLLEQLPRMITVPEHIKVEMDLDPTVPSAMVDPDRLNQVFCNIMNNAIQAMPKGGRLTIRSRQEMDSALNREGKTELVAISIEDSGMGIESLHLKKIFEPLFTTKARGTGLGLAISHNIIEKHKGVIQVTSQIGKGSTFTVKVPIKSLEEPEGKL